MYCAATVSGEVKSAGRVVSRGNAGIFDWLVDGFVTVLVTAADAAVVEAGGDTVDRDEDDDADVEGDAVASPEFGLRAVDAALVAVFRDVVIAPLVGVSATRAEGTAADVRGAADAGPLVGAGPATGELLVHPAAAASSNAPAARLTLRPRWVRPTTPPQTCPPAIGAHPA